MSSARARVAAPLLAAVLAALGILAGAALPSAAAGQGAGSTGAELLRVTAGARAAALGGAYTGITGDPDGVFYNPAAVAWLAAAAGLGYQAYVEDVTMGSASAAYTVGPVSFGAGLVFLDAGEIAVLVPDPDFGGERGMPTGETAGATETAGRLAAALRFAGGRASAGIAAGFVASDLAGVDRSAAFLDVGAQLRLDDLTLGLAARHLGGAMDGGAMGDAPLPADARLGAAYRFALAPGYGLIATGDAIAGLRDETYGLALGAEGGLMPADGGIAAVLRAGLTLGESDQHLGRLRFGGGVALRGLALDYTVQFFEYLGTIHRVGLRWSR